MKAMYMAFAVTAILALVAGLGLGELGFSSQDRAAGSAVRLSDTAE